MVVNVTFHQEMNDKLPVSATHDATCQPLYVLKTPDTANDWRVKGAAGSSAVSNILVCTMPVLQSPERSDRHAQLSSQQSAVGCVSIDMHFESPN